MNEYIKNVDALIGSLGEIRKQLVLDLSNYEADKEALEQDRAELLQSEKDLKEREEAVKKIENVVALEAEAKSLIKKANDDITALTEAKDAFEKFKQDKIRELNTKQNDLVEREKVIKKDYEFLNKEKAQLEEDKATYKDKVAKSIVDLANEK